MRLVRRHEKHLGLVRWWARDQELMWRTRKPSRVGAGRTSVNWGLAGAALGLRGSAGPAAGKPAGTRVPGRAAVSRLSEHVQSCSALSKSTPTGFQGECFPPAAHRPSSAVRVRSRLHEEQDVLPALCSPHHPPPGGSGRPQREQAWGARRPGWAWLLVLPAC